MLARTSQFLIFIFAALLPSTVHFYYIQVGPKTGLFFESL